MRALLLLQTVLLCSQAQTWCGQPECPARPKCTNAELDLIIALDQSCSMASGDFDNEKKFAKALTQQAEEKFNVTRFAGLRFGNDSFTTGRMRSKIFHSMQGGAALFDAAQPVFGTWNSWCGGTPTDEAFLLFANELNQTRKAGRMQVAVLLTDGVPTYCYTLDTSTDLCTGNTRNDNPARASRAADIERKRVLPEMGTVIVTVGIGSDLTTNTGYALPGTSKNLTGQELLRSWASAPQFALLATNFETLISETLAQVLDLLCFYVLDVENPAPCYSAGSLFTIRGYNIFPMSTPPKCRWNQAGTQNYIYTDANITLTDEKFGNETGTIGKMTCRAPASLPSDPFNAVLELSRDGVFFSSNEFTVVLRENCNAPIEPICPNASIAEVFKTCSMEELQAKSCSSTCRRAAESLLYDFRAYGIYPAFTEEQMRRCLLGISSLSQLQRDLILLGRGNPCITSPFPPATTSGASGCVASFLFLVVGVFLSW